MRSRLTDCTDSRPVAGFSLCRLLKSYVRSKFSILIAFISSLLLFLSKLSPSVKNELLTKTNKFSQPNGKSRTVLAKEIVFVIAGQLSPQMNGFRFSNPSPIRQYHFKIQSKSDELTVSKSKFCLNSNFCQSYFAEGKITPAQCLSHEAK